MKTNSLTDTLPSPDSRLLRFALLGNALFSTLSGLLLLLAPGTVGNWLGVEADWILRVLGAGLLGFALDLIHQATRSRMVSWRGLLSSLADLAWVLSTAGLLILTPGWFSPLGAGLLIAVASVVLVFGCLQFLGVKRLHQVPGSSRIYRHCVLVEAQAPASVIWESVGQLGDISRFMPTLKHSFIRDDRPPGTGCVRQCEDQSGKKWAEECTAYNPATRSLEVNFLCGEPGFPFPASSMRGGWRVNPIGESSCEVMVWWELEPEPAWMAAVFMPVLAFQVDRDFPVVIGNMVEHNADQRDAGISTGLPPARVIPRFC